MVNPAGTLISSSALQVENADAPIYVTPSWISTVLREEQLEKADDSIVVTLSGIVIVSNAQSTNALLPISVNLLSLSNSTLERLKQLLKHPKPRDVILFGIKTLSMS